MLCLDEVEKIAGLAHFPHGLARCLVGLTLASRPSVDHRFHTGEDIALCAHPQLGFFDKSRAHKDAIRFSLGHPDLLECMAADRRRRRRAYASGASIFQMWRANHATGYAAAMWRVC